MCSTECCSNWIGEYHKGPTPPFCFMELGPSGIHWFNCRWCSIMPITNTKTQDNHLSHRRHTLSNTHTRTRAHAEEHKDKAEHTRWCLVSTRARAGARERTRETGWASDSRWRGGQTEGQQVKSQRTRVGPSERQKQIDLTVIPIGPEFYTQPLPHKPSSIHLTSPPWKTLVCNAVTILNFQKTAIRELIEHDTLHSVNAVPPDAVLHVSSKLVLILPTSGGWEAELTYLVQFIGMTGARTQDPKILSQPS